mmetsp:Transcript_36927/g.108888  ORF Transcript_36927/g.108888 Transcript_36927/m.108888 type:complete len:247 (+) Transcript_36927:277-1017(+)
MRDWRLLARSLHHIVKVLPVALPLRILLLADDLALGALRLHTASDKRLGQAHIPWEAWTLVQVIKAGHASQQPLAVVLVLPHSWIAHEAQVRQFEVGHHVDCVNISYRVVCKVERREARQLCQVRDIIGILQLISAQVERFKGLEVRQPRDRRDVVLRQIECVQLRQALQPADIDDRVTPKVQASQVHKMVQVFDGADCVLLQVQSLQAGVLIQVLKLNYALALKVKHIIELWCRRVQLQIPTELL